MILQQKMDASMWQYVWLDYGWVLWDDYKTKVDELCDYAEKKGIGVFLWYGVNNVNHTAAGAYPKADFRRCDGSCN